MITIETKRLFLYPISDEEMQTIIDNEKDPEMKKDQDLYLPTINTK